MKVLSKPLTLFIRKLSTQTAVKINPSSKFHPIPQDVKITRLTNGLVVASFENYSPISKAAVIYKAGPRHETYENLGINHCIRSLATQQTTKRSTGFNISRNLQKIGGNLSCTTSREHIFYSVEAPRSDFSIALEQLDYISTGQVFKPWEISDIKSLIKLELALLENNFDDRLFEDLHLAAYRQQLGNSLYMAPDRVGSHSINDLEMFAKSRFVSSNAAIVGVGLDHDYLVSHAKKFHFLQANPSETVKSKYYGGEKRKEVAGTLAHVSVVTEGLSLSSSDNIPLAILQLILDAGSVLKYPTNQLSKLTKAAAQSASQPFEVRCISMSHSDSGLFGFHLVSDAKDTGKIIKSLVTTMNQATKGTITEEELQRAKNQLKLLIHSDGENVDNFLENLGVEVLSTGQFLSLNKIDSSIDKVTLDDVNKICKKVINGKPSIAAIGNLSHTPYLDSLLA